MTLYHGMHGLWGYPYLVWSQLKGWQLAWVIWGRKDQQDC